MTASGYKPTETNKISETRYRGKLCDLHPEAQGERHIRTYLCCECVREKKQIRRNAYVLSKALHALPRDVANRDEEAKLAATKRRAIDLAQAAGQPAYDWQDFWIQAVEIMAKGTGSR